MIIFITNSVADYFLNNALAYKISKNSEKYPSVFKVLENFFKYPFLSNQQSLEVKENDHHRFYNPPKRDVNICAKFNVNPFNSYRTSHIVSV